MTDDIEGVGCARGGSEEGAVKAATSASRSLLDYVPRRKCCNQRMVVRRSWRSLSATAVDATALAGEVAELLTVPDAVDDDGGDMVDVGKKETWGRGNGSREMKLTPLRKLRMCCRRAW